MASVSDRQKRRRVHFLCAASAELNGYALLDGHYNSTEAALASDAPADVPVCHEPVVGEPAGDVFLHIEQNSVELEPIVDLNDSYEEPQSEIDDMIDNVVADVNNDFEFDDGTADNDSTDQQFNKQLASWVVECQIPQCHVDKLLKHLKSNSDFDATRLLGMAIWPSQQRRAEDELFVCQRVSATDGEMAPSVT